MTLASALVRTPVGSNTDLVDPNAPVNLASALQGATPAPAPRPVIVQQQPQSGLAATLAKLGIGGGTNASGKVPTDLLARALMQHAMPTGPMYNAIEPIGRLAELWAGNSGEQGYLQQRQKAVASYGASLNSGDIPGAISAGLNSPLPEVQQAAMEMAQRNLYAQVMGAPSPISGLQFFMKNGQMYSMDPAGNFKLVGGADQGAGGSPQQTGGPQAGGGGDVAQVPQGGGGVVPPTGGPSVPSGGASEPSGDIPVNGRIIGRIGYDNRIMMPTGATVLQSIYGGPTRVDPADPSPQISAARKELLDKSASFGTVRDAASQYYSVRPQANKLITGPAASAMVTAFSRVINPNAVLKPGMGLDPQTAAAAQSMGFTDAMMSELNTALTGTGTISQSTIGAMTHTVNNVYNQADQRQTGNEDPYRALAKQIGIPESIIAPDVRGGFRLPQGPPVPDKTTGAAAAPAIQPGTIEKGDGGTFIFQGGDPAQQQNWKPVS